jgi:CheY-like chemotaxis protein
MSHGVRILSICDDDGLRFSRQLLLDNEGYETASVTSDAALSKTAEGTFDIALICRSVDPEREVALIALLRDYHPEIQILRLTPVKNGGDSSGADPEPLTGPEPLLEALRVRCAVKAAARELMR